MSKIKKIRIGTRGSPLAMVQTNTVQAKLRALDPQLDIEIKVIKTSGDWTPQHGEKPLEETAGGKAQFAKEIEEALLAGHVDIGVHSMKDMDSNLPAGLVIHHMLPRERPEDTLIVNRLTDNCQKSLDALPEGCRVATSSVRRAAFLKSRRPDLEIVPIRGNVHTRLEKLENGIADATLLALAGLRRLGLEDKADIILTPDDFLPAAGQGAVGIEMRSLDHDPSANNKVIATLLDHINCPNTLTCVCAERATLKALDGTCHTPIAAYATLKDNSEMHLRVEACALDGSQSFTQSATETINSPEEATTLGLKIGAQLKAELPAGFLS